MFQEMMPMTQGGVQVYEKTINATSATEYSEDCGFVPRIITLAKKSYSGKMMLMYYNADISQSQYIQSYYENSGAFNVKNLGGSGNEAIHSVTGTVVTFQIGSSGWTGDWVLTCVP